MSATQCVVDLPDPDPSLFVRIRIIPSLSKNRKKTLIYTVLCLLYDFLSLKNDVMYLQKVAGISQVTDEKNRTQTRKLVSGTNLRIWICTKISRIHNTPVSTGVKNAVLRIRDVYPGFRILIFTQKIVTKLSKI